MQARCGFFQASLRVSFMRASFVRASLAASVIAMGLAATPRASKAADYAFVGSWQCRSSVFTFTNRTFNDGSMTQRIRRVRSNGNDYVLTFANNFRIALTDVSDEAMSWHSVQTGDTFTCRRKS